MFGSDEIVWICPAACRDDPKVSSSCSRSATSFQPNFAGWKRNRTADDPSSDHDDPRHGLGVGRWKPSCYPPAEFRACRWSFDSGAGGECAWAGQNFGTGQAVRARWDPHSRWPLRRGPVLRRGRGLSVPAPTCLHGGVVCP